MCCWSVGLVQREIERAGFSTITLSTIPAFTLSVSPPRVAGIEYPQGIPFGLPHDRKGQTAVLTATLDALVQSTGPGRLTHLPFEWKKPPTGFRMHPPKPPPIARYIMGRPWLYFKFVSGDIPG